MTIAQLADEIGVAICKQAGLEEETKRICYGVEYILLWLISQTFVLCIGFLVGAFIETVAVMIGAIVMKYIIGGSHLSGLYQMSLI